MGANPSSNRQAFVTISVDDGHATDLHTAELLSKYGLPATFYVPARNPERPVMSSSEMRQIAQQFELGGHTMNHVPLNSVAEDRVWQEISEGKAWLEDFLGKQVRSFCYPRGKHNTRIVELVKKAGFVGARTCLLNRHDFPSDPFLWGVSTQGYALSRTIQVRHALVEGNFQGALNFLWMYKATTDWAAHFKRALDEVEANGGIAHLYFHCWEIDGEGEWQKLESVLQSISLRKNMKKVTNGDLFALWNGQKRAARN
jgi:peptidoglycan/xylan/chitin deacetylase (PgdA/CDA1 family)